MVVIKSLFVLFLYIGGNPIEWTPHSTLSECLSIKRKIERAIGGQASDRYSCKKETVEIEKSSNRIINFVDKPF